MPEFVLAFFGASIGTSAPEVVVDITALIRGAPGIALGDALGSSLVDSTLSIGTGSSFLPAEVTRESRSRALSTRWPPWRWSASRLGGRRRHDRPSGALLFALYGASYLVLLKMV